jgi:Family of unknown function (DUF5677)
MNSEANSSDTSVEATSMQLLQDLQHELDKAVISLGGKQKPSVQDKYYFYAAVLMNRIAHGFVFLRKNGYADAAKFLIRPAIESMIRIRAVQKQPHLVYQIMYTEMVEDDKWMGSAAKRLGCSYTARRDTKDWIEFKNLCISQFGAENIVDKELGLYSAAQIVGLESYYDTHYRMYSRYTHVGLQAMSGKVDSLSDPEDSRMLVFCAFAALDGIASMGAGCANLKSLRERVANLGAREPEPLQRIREND